MTGRSIKQVFFFSLILGQVLLLKISKVSEYFGINSKQLNGCHVCRCKWKEKGSAQMPISHTARTAFQMLILLLAFPVSNTSFGALFHFLLIPISSVYRLLVERGHG